MATMGSHGYLVSYVPVAHPLRRLGRKLATHRIALYDKIGDGPHACAMCGCEVDWFAEGNALLHTDHIDYRKTNCSPENLRALCRSCSRGRTRQSEGWTPAEVSAANVADMVAWHRQRDGHRPTAA